MKIGRKSFEALFWLCAVQNNLNKGQIKSMVNYLFRYNHRRLLGRNVLVAYLVLLILLGAYGGQRCMYSFFWKVNRTT